MKLRNRALAFFVTMVMVLNNVLSPVSVWYGDNKAVAGESGGAAAGTADSKPSNTEGASAAAQGGGDAVPGGRSEDAGEASSDKASEAAADDRTGGGQAEAADSAASKDAGTQAGGSQEKSQQTAEPQSGAQQPAEPQPGAQQGTEAKTTTLTQTIKTSQGKSYTVTVTYGADAAIPEGADLRVTELVRVPDDYDQKRDTDYKDRPFETEQFLDAGELASRDEAVAHALGVSDEQYVFFTKHLVVELVEGDAAYAPQAPVEISVQTDDVPAASASALEALARDGEGYSRLSTEDRAGADELAAGGEVDPDQAAGWPARVRFITSCLGEVALAGVVEPKASWEHNGERVTLLGAKSTSVAAEEAGAQEREDGVEAVAAFAAHVDPNPVYGTDLWLKAERDAGAGRKRSGIVAWLLDGEGNPVDDVLTVKSDKPVSFRANKNAVAVGWDPGFAQGTIRAGDVTITGELPEGARADVADVAADYADADALAGADTSGGSRARLERETLAAYDIAVKAGGEEYAPDEERPLAVTVADVTVGADDTTEVYRVDADGNATQCDADTKDGGVSFEATDAGTYVVMRATLRTRLRASDGRTYEVEVALDPASDVPVGTELRVREIAEGEEGYADYVLRAAEALGKRPAELAVARPFDISLVDPLTGRKWQPGNDARVSISLLGEALPKESDLSVVHFAEGKEGEGTKPEEVDCVANGSKVEFRTDGFSVFVVAGYTVDFHWGEYTYSIKGESEIALSELFKKLGVTEIALADVAEVSFSDSTLVAVEKKDADWLLKSLKPFNTDETLTLTLKNGKSVEIKVTDENSAVIGSWPCGAGENDDVTCTLYSNGDMVISGTGAMKDYINSPWVKDTPWYQAGVMDRIQRVVVSNGITHLGTNTFTRAGSLAEIDASDCTTMEDTGNDLFKVDSGKSHLTRIDLSGNTSFTGFGINAFQNTNTIQYIDVSDTQLTKDIFSNTTAGFGASKGNITTLKASNCAKLTGNLDLSGHTSLATLELSGCTDLTSLTVPSEVTTLDVSGCTGLTSLTVPTSVTTLNVSGCTGLATLDVMDNASLTTLNLTDCTGISTLYLPASVTALDGLANCTGLKTVYFNDTRQVWDTKGFAIPSGVTLICADGELTITAKNASKVYDGSALIIDSSPDNVTVDGQLFQGHRIESIELTGSQTEAGESACTPQNARILDEAGQDVTSNYTIDYRSGTLTVTSRPVTVKAGGTKAYGDADPAPAVTGLVGTDTAGTDDADTVKYTLTRTAGENIGEYHVTVTGDTVQGNYTVTFAGGTLRINRAPVIVTALDKEKVQGEADPALTASVTGLKKNEPESVITYTIAREDSGNNHSGTYAIIPSGEAEQGNYTVAYVSGTLTIQQLTIAFKSGSEVLRQPHLEMGEALGDLIEPIPYKYGYTFTGWYPENSSNPVTANSTYTKDSTSGQLGWLIDPADTSVHESDTTLHARYTYTVHFEADGATLSETDRVVDEGAAIGELPAPVKEGYRFTGWLAPDGSPALATTVFEGHTTLTASFVRRITVTFDPDGAELTQTTRVIDENAAVGELPELTKESYVFRGWFTQQSGGTQVTAQTTFDHDTTLYARFAKQVKVTFVDEEKATSVEKNVEDDRPIAAADFPANPDVETGCTFDGWYTDKASWSPAGKVIAGTTVFANDTTVYARRTVTITFKVQDSNGTELSSNDVTITKGTSLGDEMPQDPVLDGYAFKGWFVDLSDSSTKIAATDIFSANTTVTAKLTKQVTIAFLSGGTRHEFVVDEGDDVTLIENPNKAGYRFDGWFIANDAGEPTGKRITNSEGVVNDEGNTILDDHNHPVRVITATKDMTLAAKFVELINVRYVVVHPSTWTDHSGQDVKQPSINNEASFKLDKTEAGLGVDEAFYKHIPAVSGYYFAGWYHVTKVSDTTEGYNYDTDFLQNSRFIIDNKVYAIDESKPVYTRNDDDTGTIDPNNSLFTEDTYVVAKLIKEVTITLRYQKGEDTQEQVVRDRCLVGRPLSYYYTPLVTSDAGEGEPGPAYREGFRVEWLKEGTVVPADYDITADDDNAVFDAHYVEQVTATFQDENGNPIADVGGDTIHPITRDINTALGTLPTVPPAIGEGNQQRQFIGWFDSDGREYTAETILTGNVTLTAKYGYQVRFKVEGDDQWSFTRLVEPNAHLGWMPGAPYKEGHSFKNWTLGDAVVDGAYVVSKNVEIVGHYDKVSIYTITVNYKINGEEGATDTKIVSVDKSTVTAEHPYVIESPATFKKNGKNYYPVMTALQLVPDDSTGLGVKSKHVDVSVAQSLADPTKITITVPYKETDAVYTVYYKLLKLNGNEAVDADYVVITEETESNVPGVMGAVVSPTIKDLSYAKYKKADTGTIERANGQEFSVYYTRKEFKLTYDSTVSDVRISPDAALYGASVTLPTPTRTGYDFDGWYTEYNAGTGAYSGTRYEGDASYTLMGETTLYAKWKVKSVNYTVVYLFEKFNDAGTASSFVYDSSETLQGDVGSTVYATDSSIPVKSRTAYQQDDTHNASSSVEIAADGSSVLFVYYKLIEFTFKFRPGTFYPGDGPYEYYVTASLDGEAKTGNDDYGYTMTVKLGQDISESWPTASNIRNAYCYLNNNETTVNFYGWYPDNGENSVYVTKRLIVTEDMLPKPSITNTGIVVSVTQSNDGVYVQDDGRDAGNNYTYHEFEGHLYRQRRDGYIDWQQWVYIDPDKNLTRYNIEFQQIYTYTTDTVVYTARWLTNSKEYRVNYWLQNADDNGYTISEKYSQTLYMNSGGLGAKPIAGYTNVETPSGYPESGDSYSITSVTQNNRGNYVQDDNRIGGPDNTYYTFEGHLYRLRRNSGDNTLTRYNVTLSNIYTYNFYYNRDTFKIDFFYGSKNLKTIESVKFDASINKTPYVWTPTADECDLPDGFTFDGWYSDSGLTSPYTFGVMPAANLGLYAKWIPPVYTVTFYEDQADYASGKAYYTKEVEYDSVVGTVQNPAGRENELFEYWFNQTDNMKFFPAETPIQHDTVVIGHWQPKEITRYRVMYLYTDNDGTKELLPTKYVYGRWHLGDEVTEIAPYVTGYAEHEDETMVADAGKKELVLTYNDDTNQIVFNYDKKPENIYYSVYYLLWDAHDKNDKLTNESYRVANPKIHEKVSGSYTSVTEMAAAPTVEAYLTYRPTKTTDTLDLGTVTANNVLIFYYTAGAKFTVEYLDMEGDPVRAGETTYLEPGDTYTLDSTLSGYTVDHVEKNGEATTATTFTVASVTDETSIKVYYKTNLTLLAHSANKPYDGTPLTANNLSDITASGLKEGHSITAASFTADSTRTNVGIGNNKIDRDTLVISGLKNDVTANQFYNITCLPGTLTVTKINVVISVEPDRWTGNVYDGTYWETGFTNGSKAIDDYLVISNYQFKNLYLETLWDSLISKLIANYEASHSDHGDPAHPVYARRHDALIGEYHYGTVNGKQTKVADTHKDGLVILNQRNAGDYYEESSAFLSAANAALADLATSVGDDYKNYNVILYVRESRLEITPAPLTITTEEAEKSYDGTPLTTDGVNNEETRMYNGLTVNVRGTTLEPTPMAPNDDGGYNYALATGDTVTIKNTGSQLTPGTSQNIYEINWGTVNPANYSVSESLGALTVTKRAITITANDMVKAWGADDPDFTVTASYETDDGQGGTTSTEIPAILTHWSGNSYTLQLNDPNNGFRENISLTISREEGEVPGVYKITPASDNENFDISFVTGKLTIAVARVSNDGGVTWSNHAYLTNGDYDSSAQDSCMQGAFDYANTLTGDVIIETLCETAQIANNDDRYAMGSKFAFGGSAESVALRTTTSADFNSTGFKSVITRGFDGASLLTTGVPLTMDNIIFDGQKEKFTGGIIEIVGGNKVTVGPDAVLRNAKDENGGAVNMVGGALTMNGKIQDCEATGTGGAINASGGTLNMGGTIQSCEATGNGGAINMGGGSTLNMGGIIQSCTSGGVGGAVCVGPAASMTMTGGIIRGNSSTDGGAIDVLKNDLGQVQPKLTFSGNAVVYDNLSGNAQKNVVLSIDDNGIINASDIGKDAKIGVYVPNDAISGESAVTLFDKHGGMRDQFGKYARFTTATNVGSFVNDRNGFTGRAHGNNAMIWTQPIRVEVRYIDPADEDYTSMPTRYTVMYRSSNYDPPADPSSIDNIFDDIRSRYGIGWVNSSEEMVPWLAFVNNRGAAIDKNVLGVLSNTSTNGKWAYQINNETNLTQTEDQTLILYYTKPAYDLKIQKAVKDDTGIEKTFDVKIHSRAIIRDRYIVLDADGASSTVSATPTRGSTPGSLTVKVKAGSEIIVKNLSGGDYTIAEPTQDYTVTAWTKTDDDNAFTPLEVTEDDKHEMQVTVDEDRVLEITNTRKKVNVTVQKTVLADDTSGDFSITATVTDEKTATGEYQHVKGFTIYDGGTPNETSDNLVTNDDGKVTFTLAHDGSQVLSVPSGANVEITENLTEEQKKEFAVFMAMPGDSNHMVSGASEAFELSDVREAKALRVFNIPSICKVTDGSGNLLYFLNDNDTADDTKDDIYIPAIYGTIHGAFDHINDHQLYGKAGTSYSAYSGSYQVQMLVDYLVPSNDLVKVDPGFDITFTTAKVNSYDGYSFRRTGAYSGVAALGVIEKESIGRAVLQREAGSTEAFFTVSSEDATNSTTFTMSELIIDGRHADLNDGVRGGCLTAHNSDATIDNCAIHDFEAKQGSAVYTTGSSLIVSNSVFDTCISKLGGDKKGGGAIHTTATALDIKESRFLACSAIWQGGAVYQYGQNKSMLIDGCDFIECTSRSGGAVEADVTTVDVSGCAFVRCTAEGTKDGGNGGALNNFYENGNDVGSSLTVDNCTFQGCRSLGTGSLLGGSLRSKARTVNVTNCDFLDDNSNPENPIHNVAKNGGGAAFDSTNSTITFSRCTFANCEATENGGGIYAVAKELKIDETDSISGCSAKNGGAVYVDKGKLTLTGGIFNGNTATAAGAAIYLTDHAKTKLDISGAPIFGDGTTNRPANTVSMSRYAGKENGGDGTAYTGGVVRQDIYLSEAHENAPATITVQGDMTGEDASIWVWAKSEYHYKQLMPFAILKPGVNGGTLKVFRNARPDDETENATDTYLRGTIEGDKAGYVYWTGIAGSRRIILRKVDSTYTSVNGKSFTIYKGASVTAYTPKGETNPLSGLTSGASGCFWIGNLPYGWYIIEESDPHVYFFLVVTENGTYGTLVGEDNGSLSNRVGGFDTREAAETAAKALYDAKK